MLRLTLAVSCLGLLLLVGASREAPPKGTPELGQVVWERDLDVALARARAEARPVFALFQEVPGCATCVGFGETVLSDPLLVEAIETEFVPLAILNNRGGHDREVLRRYGEPAWNNPVVRFLDADGGDVLPRRSGLWETHGIAERMAEALRASKRPVPAYLGWVLEETRPHVSERMTFGMHCYWSGEACLGAEVGILETRAGTLGGREVVEVTFDPQQVDYETVLRRVWEKGCTDQVFVHRASRLPLATTVFGERASFEKGAARSASERDRKYHLRRSPLASLDLSPLQRTRVNAAIAARLDPSPWLSPRQRAAAGLSAAAAAE